MFRPINSHNNGTTKSSKLRPVEESRQDIASVYLQHVEMLRSQPLLTEDHLMEWTTSGLQMDMLIGCVDRRIVLLHDVRTYYDDSNTFQVAGILEQSSETSYMQITNLQEVPFLETVLLAINRMHGMGYEKYQANLHWENRNRQEILTSDTNDIDRRGLRFWPQSPWLQMVNTAVKHIHHGTSADMTSVQATPLTTMTRSGLAVFQFCNNTIRRYFSHLP
jgi:hypothetical protein